jgi:hypothetical protein
VSFFNDLFNRVKQGAGGFFQHIEDNPVVGTAEAIGSGLYQRAITSPALRGIDAPVGSKEHTQALLNASQFIGESHVSPEGEPLTNKSFFDNVKPAEISKPIAPSAGELNVGRGLGMNEAQVIEAKRPADIYAPISKTASPPSPIGVEGILNKVEQESQKLPTLDFNKPGLFQRIVTPVQKIIGNMGEGGKQLSSLLDTQRTIQDRLSNDWLRQVPDVLKLNKQEAPNFFDVIEQGAKPVSPTVEKAVAQWRTLSPQVREEGLRSGLQIGNIADYVPHNYQQIFQDKNRYNDAINHLVDKGLAKDQGEAVSLLNSLRNTPSDNGRPFGQLELPRQTDLPLYEKTKESLQHYLIGSARRVSEARTFGPQDEIAHRLVARTAQEGFDAETAKRAFDIAVGNARYDQTAMQISRGIRTFLGVTKLGTAAISNLGQTTNTAAVAGVKNTLGGYLKYFSNPADRAFVQETAVAAEHVIASIREGAGFLNKITAPGMTTIERINRGVSAIAGRDWAEGLATRAANGDPRALSVLRTKLKVEGPIGAKLTEEQAIQAARSVSDITQFRVSSRDLPLFADSPQGRLIAQFRAFAYKQTAFMKDEIIKPLGEGNALPLMRFLIVGIPVGAAIAEAKNKITGRDTSGQSLAQRAIEGLLQVGGAGLPGDIARTFSFVKNAQGEIDTTKVIKAIAQTIAPAAGEAVKAINAGTALANKQPALAASYIAGQTPIVGSRLSDVAYNTVKAATPSKSKRGSGSVKGSKGRKRSGKVRVARLGGVRHGTRKVSTRAKKGRAVKVASAKRFKKTLIGA